MQKKLVTDPIIDAISVDAAWTLVEKFSTMPRWQPKDVNKSADIIVRMLRDEGVPVTVHKPTVYLSIPFGAEVRASGQVMKAKPPAYSRDCRNGIEGELVYVPASYSRSVGTLFAMTEDATLSTPERLRGKIVISEGFAFPAKMLEFEQKGAIGAIAVNPGADAHWGICTSIWGTPDLDDLPRKPGIPVAAVNNPDGRQLIALAKTGARATVVTTMEEGWYQQKVPIVEIRGEQEPEKFVSCMAITTAGTSVSGTMRRATQLYSSWRACSGNIASRSSARFGLPGGLATRRAAMPARPGMPTRSP